MYEIKLNENESISLDIKTILSCMYIFNADCLANEKFCEECVKEMTHITLDLMYEENKESFLRDDIVRKSVLLGLVEKIKNEFSMCE